MCSNQYQFQKQNELQLEVIMTMIYLEPQNTSHQQNSFMLIQEIPLNQIRRPLPRQNDPEKVKALMESIAAIGQKEPIDVLEVDGQYYGFSGCHRYEACQRLGKETIIARVRKAPKSVLKMHLA